MMLSIGKLAQAGNVGVETIRFYQRKGLLTTPAGTGGMRRYGEEHVRRLRFIRKAQAAGFTLEEIRELISLDASDDRQRVRELASQRIEALEVRMAELQNAHDALQHLVTACSSGDRGPCPILAAFEK